MTDRDTPVGSRPGRTLVATRPSPDDIRAARRVATFGGGDPTIGDAIRGYVRRYGWRAYALPILVVVTTVALATASNGPTRPPTSHPVAGGSPTVAAPSPAGPSIGPKSDHPSGTSPPSVANKGQLPPGPQYTAAGTGTFYRLPGTSKVVGRPSTGRIWRYDIEVENGIRGIDLSRYAAMVQRVLSDPRSWSGHGIALQRVGSGRVDFHVSLTSAMTVRKYCGYDIKVETSCYARAGTVAGLDANRVVLNDARWVRGSQPYKGHLNAYRIYMINHEDGHALEHRHAHQCLPGGLAPVMMQQTFGLKSAENGQQCRANAWPYPTGAVGAPGAEQADTPTNNELNLD
ncbi:MAG: DUF3152 domain-containing protein [Actinomycetota bacterium]|nr:DUF3152 domain-containing protein [Actinomycetota bacterium]